MPNVITIPKGIKEHYNVGDTVNARVIKIDREDRRIGLSIKAANYDSDQLAAEAAAYDSLKGDSDLASLGDIMDELG